jgi:hypothetical protein
MNNTYKLMYRLEIRDATAHDSRVAIGPTDPENTGHEIIRAKSARIPTNSAMIDYLYSEHQAVFHSFRRKSNYSRPPDGILYVINIGADRSTGTRFHFGESPAI